MRSNGTVSEKLKRIAVRTLFADPRDKRTLAGIAQDLEGVRSVLPANYSEVGALLGVSVAALCAVSRRRPPGNAEEIVHAAATTIRTAEEFVSDTVDDDSLASLRQAGRTLRGFLASASGQRAGEVGRSEAVLAVAAGK